MAGVEGQQLPVCEVYTDGSITRAPQPGAVGPPSPAGCAWVMRGEHDWPGQYFALGDQTDSEEVELLAIYLALKYLVKFANEEGRFASQVLLFSDCSYALSRIEAERSNYGSSGEPVLRSIASLAHQLELTWSTPVTLDRVAAHQGNAGNERADCMAQSGSHLSSQGFHDLGWWTGVGPILGSFPLEHPR